MSKSAAAVEPYEADAPGKRLITTDAVNHLDLDVFIVQEEDNHSRAQMGNRYGDADFKDLMASIRESGVHQPILYALDEEGQPHVRIGFRRLEAAKRIREAEPQNPHVKTIPAIEIDSIAAADKITLLRANVDENARRKGLTPLDQAYAVEAFAASGLKPKDIAAAMRKSPGTITKLRALYNAPDEIKKAVHAGDMDLETAYETTRKSPEVQHAVVEAIRGGVQAAATEAAGDDREGTGDQAEGAGKGRKAGGKVKAPKRLTRKDVRGASVAKGTGKLKVAREKGKPGVLGIGAVVAGRVAVKALGQVRKLAAQLESSKRPASAKAVGACIVGLLDEGVTVSATRAAILKQCAKDPVPAKTPAPKAKAPAKGQGTGAKRPPAKKKK